ncbi:MFS transporter [Paraburkholderia silviterrae]|uniref:MFS transporter n=1 Tax=Paraburkholderia silviterrae TaxID=2528715 RepID=A0A4R5M8K3_9BURK|nr:MFS transporter [Paraburkholderia silviterrae]TDG22786.1 MFS transporter [Paraburkholderia silviterrae]
MAIDIVKRKGLGSTIVLCMLCLAYLITYIDRVNLSTAAPVIKVAFQLSNTQLGFIFACFGYSYTAFQIVGGWMADKYGARKTLFLFGAIWSISTFMTGLVGGFVSLGLARLMLGIGEGATFPAATRAIRQWIPASRWGFAQGLTHAASRFGTGIAPPLVVALMAMGSWREPFYVLGVLSITWSVAWVVLYRDGTPIKSDTTGTESMTPGASRSNGKMNPKAWRNLIFKMLPVAALYFCYAWCIWMYLSWIPSMMKEAFSLNLETAAAYSAGVLMAGVAGDLIGGLLTDRLYRKSRNLAFARKALIVFSMLGSAACLSGLMFFRGVNSAALCLAIGLFLLELTVAPAWSLPMDIAPESSGTASGIMNAGGGIAGIISPFLFGFVLDETKSWMVPFYITIGILLVGALITLRLKLTSAQQQPLPNDGAADTLPMSANT